jgi:hypothetical protein
MVTSLAGFDGSGSVVTPMAGFEVTPEAEPLPLLERVFQTQARNNWETASAHSPCSLIKGTTGVSRMLARRGPGHMSYRMH